MAVAKSILAVIVILVIALGAVSAYAVDLSSKTTSTTTTPTSPTASTVTTTLTTTASATANVSADLASECQAEGGTITLYSFFSPSGTFPPINATMVAAFPWFKINYVQLGFGDVATRALTEYDAGHVVADSIVDTRSDLEILENASALQAWNNPNIAIMNWTGSDQYQTSFYYDPLLLIWNTNKITDNASLPTTWTDLANPEWKGELAFDDPSTLNTAGPLFSSLEPSMGNSSWTAFMKSLAANDPIITQGTSDSYTDVSTGQAEIGIALIDDVAGGLASHPPVGYKYIDPTYGDPASIAVLKGAPHPYCAELFELFMTSYGGALSLVKGGTPSGIPLVNTQYLAFWPYPANATILAAGPPSIYSDPTMWTNIFTGIFGP
jgi:ABC-type Fe3+ transport system substrate-binding protein